MLILGLAVGLHHSLRSNQWEYRVDSYIYKLIRHFLTQINLGRLVILRFIDTNWFLKNNQFVQLS